MKALVTGANGFVGLAVTQRLREASDVEAVGSVRRVAEILDAVSTVMEVGDLTAQTDWSLALAGVDVVGGSTALRVTEYGYCFIAESLTWPSADEVLHPGANPLNSAESLRPALHSSVVLIQEIELVSNLKY